jgi:hypothetical protein
VELLSKLTPSEQKQLYQFVHKADGTVKGSKWTKERIKAYQREWVRNKYHNDPEWRAKQRARGKEWRRKNPEKMKAANERRKLRKEAANRLDTIPDVVEDV